MNVKSIIKKIALALAGVAAITAVGFGVKAIVDYTKNDLKTISPSFEVGNLGSDGKFVEDKSTLYTKDAFACYGLQVKPDFDSAVNYQVFYYDILDNYISSTSSMSDGYSGEAPINGAYARLVIEPKNDEDGKISLTERIKYPKQLTVKVKKNQEIDKRFVSFKGKIMQVVSDTDSLHFVGGLCLAGDPVNWIESDNRYCVTSTTILSVAGGSTFSYDFSSLSEDYKGAFCIVTEFKDLPLDENFNKSTTVSRNDLSLVLDKNTKYIVITADTGSQTALWLDSHLSTMRNLIKITKTK